jgi:hypothetical protein
MRALLSLILVLSAQFLVLLTPPAAFASPTAQVAIVGTRFFDASGDWTPRGVQFILPQHGINGRTFHDARYAAAKADGSLTFWLDRAQHGLGANLLRIFVDLPRIESGTLITPTSVATVLDFAQAAGARGMRLGIVIHNSAGWTMTIERADWLRSLLDTFAAAGALPLIAYISASNEINNYCGSAMDCFDSDSTRDAQPYITSALGWVAEVRALVKTRTPQLLLTVGITTEREDRDNTRAAFNFFRADGAGRTLAQLVDFLSPHNFGGGAQGIINDLRFAGYTGAVLLEEFGFPTDPAPRNRFWSEGPQVCRLRPEQPECFETAPFFVEANLNAVRKGGYAGAVAWMLADMAEKDTDRACSNTAKPPDLWTGLFAIGGSYCDGGTITRTVGAPKATAVRVCFFYTGDLVRCDGGIALRYRTMLPVVAR